MSTTDAVPATTSWYEPVMTIVGLVTGGLDTTTNALGNITYHLATPRSGRVAGRSS